MIFVTPLQKIFGYEIPRHFYFDLRIFIFCLLIKLQFKKQQRLLMTSITIHFAALKWVCFFMSGALKLVYFLLWLAVRSDPLSVFLTLLKF